VIRESGVASYLSSEKIIAVVDHVLSSKVADKGRTEILVQLGMHE
jgi:hypothetical protein